MLALPSRLMLPTRICARCAAANNPTPSLAQHPTDSSERTPDAAMPPAAAVTTPDDGYTMAGTNPIDYPSTSSQRSFPISGRVRKDCNTPQRSICFDAMESPVPSTDLCNGCCGNQEEVGPLVRCRLCQEWWCDACFDDDTKHWLRCKPEIERLHRAKNGSAQTSVMNEHPEQNAASEAMNIARPVAALS